MDQSIILVGGGKIIYEDKYFIKTHQSISNQIMTTLLLNNKISYYKSYAIVYKKIEDNFFLRKIADNLKSINYRPNTCLVLLVCRILKLVLEVSKVLNTSF